jgi:5-methylcytosine-specific restriction endonuclease McrA
MNAVKVLERPVLVLNKIWRPLRVTTVQDAIGLVAKGHALIIDAKNDFTTHALLSWNDVSRAKQEWGDGVIRSCHLMLMPPEVIMVTTYEKQGERSVVFSRRNLFKRDRYTCQYCGDQPTNHEDLTMDHIVPRSKGGKSTWENTVLACFECNKRKADRTPEQAGMKLKKVPKKPSWKTLVQVPPKMRKESWQHFLDRAYWEVELEA